MKSSKDVLAWAQRRFANHRQRWLNGEGDWPLELSLDRPGEREILKGVEAVRAWSESWSRLKLPAGTTLSLETVAYRSLGEQRLPARIRWESPAAVSAFLGNAEEWHRVVARRNRLFERWPTLGIPGFEPRYGVLASESDADFERLFALLEWLDLNPRSGLYVRQLPVVGVDTKWIDRHRRRVVSDMLRRIRGAPEVLLVDTSGESDPDDVDSLLVAGTADFHQLCGLRKPAPRLRLLVLCPKLRANTAGLRDIESSLDDLAKLQIAPRRVLVLENLETGYSLPDIEGAVALVKLGNAVGLAGQLPWLRGLPVVYWGDLDTHGFSILAQARRALGRVASALMDTSTLLAYRERCVREPVQTRAADLQWLTTEEQLTYQSLLDGDWGESLRLEQERIDWPAAMVGLDRLLEAC